MSVFSEQFFNRVIRYAFYVLLFLVPLILTPWNYELFEYNKMMFIYGMTVIIVGAWIGKMITAGEIKIRRTPLDIPILLYLGSYIASTIFSLDRHTSIWGYYSRFHGGLMSTISYILLYYAFISNVGNGQMAKRLNGYKKNKALKQLTIQPFNHLTIIYVLLASAFLVTFYGILEHFGIDAAYWVQDVKNRVFSTLGQPNWLGAFIDAIIFIPLALALTTKSNIKKTIYYLLSATYFFCLIFTNSKSAMLAFWVGLVAFACLTLLTAKKTWKTIGLVSLISLIGYLALGARTYTYLKKASVWLKIIAPQQQISLPPVQTGDQYVPFVSESSDIRKVVWKGAIEVWKHYPIFGSGVETFAYSYYNFRPKEHNLLSEWDFLYNKAHNEFLNILACQGLVGLITYLLLIVSFIFWSLKKLKCQNSNVKTTTQKSKLLDLSYSFELCVLSFAFLSGYITILITNFFGFSVVLIGLLFFLIPALAFTTSHELEKQKTLTLPLTNLMNISFAKNLSFLILTLSSAFLIFTLVQMWRADFYFARAEQYDNTNYLINALMSSQKAVRLNSSEAIYHDQLAQISSRLAAAYYQTDASKSATLINQLKDLAVQESKTTLELNPVHLNFYRSQAKTMIYLGLVDPQYKNTAIELLAKASLLAPTDPKILHNLALLYQEGGKTTEAQQAWEKAVELKPNYRAARLELAKLYLNNKQQDKAKEQLEFILAHIDANDKETKTLINDL